MKTLKITVGPCATRIHEKSSPVELAKGTVFHLTAESFIIEGDAIVRDTVASDPEPLPFDLEAAKAGAAVVTRDGRNVRFIGHIPEALSNCQVLAYIEGESGAREFTETGKAKPHTGESSDLFMAPPVKNKRTVWVNLYKDGSYSMAGSRDDAENFAGMHSKNTHVAIATPIEIDA